MHLVILCPGDGSEINNLKRMTYIKRTITAREYVTFLIENQIPFGNLPFATLTDIKKYMQTYCCFSLFIKTCLQVFSFDIFCGIIAFFRISAFPSFFQCVWFHGVQHFTAHLA